MRKFFWVYALIFIVGFSFLMLRNDGDEHGQIETPPEVAQSEPITIEESTDMYTISLSVPGGLPLSVHSTIQNDLDRAVTQFKEAALSMGEIPEFSGELWLTTEGVKEYTGTNTRSIEIPISEYTGGAHGNAVYYTYTFTPNGEILSLGDVLENNQSKIESVRAQATELLLDIFYADIEENQFDNPQEDLETEKRFMKEMVEAGVSEVDFNYGTWVLEDENLVLIFPPYSVAPYAYGTQRTSFPLSSI